MPLYVRPTLPTDEQFLYQLVYQTTAEQLYAWSWDPQIRDQLLDMQIRAKHGAYAVEFPNADYVIVMLDDQPVGRMIIDRAGEFYVLVDIAILPKHRSAGIGTRLILGLCMEAELMQKKVRLHVSVTNQRAAALYQRLGFRVIEDQEVNLLMERSPGDRSQVIAAP
jgi:ribosomal protein S18 acetylase RimI-like enzyme